MLSQLSRYGTARKLQLEEMAIKVTTRFHIEGSVLRGTLQGRPLVFDLHLEIKSTEPVDKVAELTRIAENSCYVIQSLLASVEIKRSVRLNGDTIEAYAPASPPESA